MNEQIKHQFFAEYKAMMEKVKSGELPEGALFKLGGEFFKETGGKLSQYNSPLAVGVAVVPVIKDGQEGFVAFKRGINPFVGGVAFPGGFVNQMEGSKEAAIRELFEEIGLDLGSAVWHHIGEKKTPANQLLIFYRCEAVLDWNDVESAYEQLADKSESQGLVFLDKDTEMCFSLHAEIRDEQFQLDNKATNKKKM